MEPRGEMTPKLTLRGVYRPREISDSSFWEQKMTYAEKLHAVFLWAPLNNPKVGTRLNKLILGFFRDSSFRTKNPRNEESHLVALYRLQDPPFSSWQVICNGGKPPHPLEVINIPDLAALSSGFFIFALKSDEESQGYSSLV